MTKSRSKRSTPLTRAAIINSARELLDADGLDELSLRRLATSLGVTAPALYAHIEGKTDLLTAVAEQGFGELVEAFDSVEATDPVERVLAYGRVYVAKALQDPEMFKVMFKFRPGDVPLADIDNELPAATTAFAKPAEAIREAMSAGRIHPDRDPVLASMTMWTAAHGVASVLMLGYQDGYVFLFDNADELIEDVLTVTVAGLATPPTRAQGQAPHPGAGSSAGRTRRSARA